MQFFNTKKSAADTSALDAAEEHKQSIGDQVMEALGVGLVPRNRCILRKTPKS